MIEEQKEQFKGKSQLSISFVIYKDGKSDEDHNTEHYYRQKGLISLDNQRNQIILKIDNALLNSGVPVDTIEESIRQN